MSSDSTNPPADPHPVWYLVVVVAAGLSSVAIALFVKGGIGDIERLRERKQQLIQAKKQRRKRLRELRQREIRLHQDPYLIEKLARQKLGLRRPGEKRIRLEEHGDTTVSFNPVGNGRKQLGPVSINPNE